MISNDAPHETDDKGGRWRLKSLTTDKLLDQLRNTIGAIAVLESGNKVALRSLRRHWRRVQDELDRRAAEAGPTPRGLRGPTPRRVKEKPTAIDLEQSAQTISETCDEAELRSLRLRIQEEIARRAAEARLERGRPAKARPKVETEDGE